MFDKLDDLFFDPESMLSARVGYTIAALAVLYFFVGQPVRAIFF